MPNDTNPPKGSIRNKIIAAFFVVIIVWGVGLTSFFQQSLQKILIKYSIREDIAREIMSNTVLITTGFTLLGIVIAMVIALFLVKVITDPISKLNSDIKDPAKKDLSTRVMEISDDEIGNLAITFNQRLDELQKLAVSRNALTQEVAERIRAEEALKKAYHELRVTQDKLIQSEKMSAIGQLASGVAHEINNPLTGVLNNVQLIKMMITEKKECSFEEFNSILADVEQASLRCKNIVQSLLDFSRSSQGLRKNLSLNDMINTVITITENELKLRNITCLKELSDSIPQVNAEPQLLQQVIYNLITNASWAIQERAEKSGGEIRFKSYFDPDKELACLEITDNGIGIDQKNIGKIFTPFFTTKEVGQGTGLGLALCYSIIQNHRGNLSFESTPNQGTTFKLTLSIFK